MAKKQLRPASAAEQFIKTAEEKPQPTAEELEAAGQQRLIDEKEAQKPKAEKKKEQTKKEAPAKKAAEPKKEEPKEQAEPPKMGQPKKYDEPTKHVSFSLPVSVIENLKILAGLRKTNQTQLVLGMINRELETEAEKIKAYKELLK